MMLTRPQHRSRRAPRVTESSGRGGEKTSHTGTQQEASHGMRNRFSATLRSTHGSLHPDSGAIGINPNPHRFSASSTPRRPPIGHGVQADKAWSLLARRSGGACEEPASRPPLEQTERTSQGLREGRNPLRRRRRAVRTDPNRLRFATVSRDAQRPGRGACQTGLKPL